MLLTVTVDALQVEAQFDDNVNTCHDVVDLRDELFVRLANSGFVDVAVL